MHIIDIYTGLQKLFTKVYKCVYLCTICLTAESWGMPLATKWILTNIQENKRLMFSFCSYPQRPHNHGARVLWQQKTSADFTCALAAVARHTSGNLPICVSQAHSTSTKKTQEPYPHWHGLFENCRMLQSVSVSLCSGPGRHWGCNSVALPPFFPTLFRTWTVGTIQISRRIQRLTAQNDVHEPVTTSEVAYIWHTWSFCCTLPRGQSVHQLWMRMRFCRVETHVPAPRSLATSFVKSWQKASAKLAVPLGATGIWEFSRYSMVKQSSPSGTGRNLSPELATDLVTQRHFKIYKVQNKINQTQQTKCALHLFRYKIWILQNQGPEFESVIHSSSS